MLGRIIKVIFGLLLFIAPISLHTEGALNINPYVMMPIGGFVFGDGKIDFGLHSTEWYSDDGRISYFIDAMLQQNSAKFFNSLYMINDEDTSKITLGGLFVIFTLYGLALYLLLSLFGYKGTNIVADVVLIVLAILNLIGFFNIQDMFQNFYDFNMPIFPIVAGILGITYLLVDLFRKPKRRRRR